jgi:hypothetical protein
MKRGGEEASDLGAIVGMNLPKGDKIQLKKCKVENTTMHHRSSRRHMDAKNFEGKTR